MTGREWQAGDVAVATLGNGTEIVVIRTKEACHLCASWAVGHWHGTAGNLPGNFPDVRPLVAIDPESAEEMERLAAAWEAVVESGPLPDQPMTMAALRMRAALREFASPTPTKPDEPTGLGAVVEAIHNNHFVRAQSGDAPWVRVADDGNARSCSWAEIAVVRVLSPGVEAGEPS